MQWNWTRIGRAVAEFSVCLGVVIVLQAQPQQAQNVAPLTLEEAVRTALDQNPAFRANLDETQAARARWKQAQAAMLPRLDVGQSFTRGDNPVYVFGTKLTQRGFTAEDFALHRLNTPAPLDNFQTRLDARWTAFDSGQSFFRRRAAERLVTAADFQTEQARQDLILEVVRSYYAVLVTREKLQATDQAVKTAEASAQRMETMHQAGLIVDSDLLSAKVFLAQTKARQIRAQDDLALAGMELARAMGVSVEAAPELAGSLAAPGTAPSTIQEWTRTALTQRPALRAAESQEEAIEQNRKAAKAQFGPQLGLFASTERDALSLGGSSGTNWTAGARLEFNVFAGGAEKARLAEAAANTEKARHNLEWVRSGVELEVRKAYLDVNAAAQRAAAARDAREQAKESLRIVQNRYAAGLTTVTELLRAQSAQLDAATEYLAALQDWQVARAQLERAAGALTSESALVTGANQP